MRFTRQLLLVLIAMLSLCVYRASAKGVALAPALGADGEKKDGGKEEKEDDDEDEDENEDENEDESDDDQEHGENEKEDADEKAEKPKAQASRVFDGAKIVGNVIMLKTLV